MATVVEVDANHYVINTHPASTEAIARFLEPVEEGPALSAAPYSYGSRDVQPGYESTWRSAEPGIEPDPWSDRD